MILRFPLRNVKDMLLNQISNNYFKSIDDEPLITKHMPEALDRLERSLKESETEYYHRINDCGEEEAYFDPLHTCQWTLFLYLMANTIYKNETEKVDAARVVCDKIYGYLKAMSNCDLYYKIELPRVFSFDHPTGSVLGQAVYGNYFSFTQGCTVDGIDGIEPVIGEHVTMKANSMILGNSRIGDNCILHSGTIVKNECVPANSSVSGKSPNLVIEKI